MIRDKEILIKNSEQFVGIIKGEVYHSHSIFDMENFFERDGRDYRTLAEIDLDGFNPIVLLTCDDDKQILRIWKTAQKDNFPFLMQYYREQLLEEADFVIKADFEEEDEPANDDW